MKSIIEHRLSQIKLSDLTRYANDNALEGYSKYRRKPDLINFILTRSINKIFPFNEDIFSSDKIESVPYKKKHSNEFPFNEDIFINQEKEKVGLKINQKTLRNCKIIVMMKKKK